jgi:hypothetical protein
MNKAKNKALEHFPPARVFIGSTLMNTNTNVTLPDAVTRYFDAANRFDADLAAACFTSDAVVHDEGKDHVGTEAIRNWVTHTSEQYQPQVTVLGARENGEKLAVAVRVAGQFPGSPAELGFELSLRDGKIAELGIQ